MKTQFYIITGLSGAGKSQALKILEDFNFFCVDNLPVALVPQFADMSLATHKKLNKIAIGIDIRAGKEHLGALDDVLGSIKKKGIDYKIIFFNANDFTLIQRYSETRRKHPLGKSVVDGIRKERKLLDRLLCLADKEIDTSNLTLGELKEILAREMNVSPVRFINVSLISFGYKYGVPVDADIIMDVRFLPNPNYVMELRYKTGKNPAVRKYVVSQKISKEFFDRFFGLLDYLMPHYIHEGKSYITIAIGCTGGRHRAVVVTEATAKFLRTKKYKVSVHHRDIDRMKV
jgi:UPF0042 nucleotide-binding protein